MSHALERPQISLVVELHPEPSRRRATEIALAALAAPSLVLAPGDARTFDSAAAKSFVKMAQGMNIAALIEGDAGAARTLGADGVHLPWTKDVVGAYREVRRILGSGFIVGADAGRSRDDAMTLGEDGADYVAFGIPPHVSDRDTARERRRELVEWWAELFEVPVVAADVESPDEAADLAAAGADFIAVRLPPSIAPDDVEAWAAEFSCAVAPREAVA